MVTCEGNGLERTGINTIIATLRNTKLTSVFFQGWQERNDPVIQVLAYSAITRFHRVEAKAWCLTSVPHLTRIRPRYNTLTPILEHFHPDHFQNTVVHLNSAMTVALQSVCRDTMALGYIIAHIRHLGY